MKFGLEEHIIEDLEKLFEQQPKIDKAIIFGSRAKGNYKPGSDIDIALKGIELNTKDILNLYVKWDDLELPFKLDLLKYETIKEPDLKDHIDRVGIELYSVWQTTEIGILPSNWKLMTLDDIKSKEKKAIISGPFGSNISSKYFVANGVPVIRGNNLSLGLGNKFKDDGFVFITNEKANELGTWATKDDIIFTAVGTIGQVGVLTGNEKYQKYIISNKQLRLRVDNTIVSPLFAYYWFASPAMIDTIEQRNTGSSVPLINLSVLKSLYIPIPPKNEQERIINLLSSLDDKIDLLHRQNKTLEQLAETLFRQWFVEEAEEDWEEIPLSEIAIHSKENVHPSKNPTKIYKHYSLPSFDAGKEPINEIGKEILSNKYKVISNSILVSKLNPRTPRIWMIYGNVNEDECICSTEFQIVKPKDQKWYGFIYCFLKSNQVTQELAGASSGTSGSHQRVNPQDIFNLTFLKPTDTLIEEFSKIIDNYLVKINNNQTQIRTLTQTRNNLLPKLMSGEVRVTL